MLSLFNLIFYSLFLLFSCDHCVFILSQLVPPDVADDDIVNAEDRDAVKEVQKIIISSQYFFVVTTKSEINNMNYTTISC